MAIKMFARGMLDNISTFTATRNASTPVMAASLGSSPKTLYQALGINGSKRIAAEKPADAPLVPDVRGYSAREAIRILEQRGIDVSISGQGRVVAQSIPKGTPVTRNMKIKLILKV